MSKETTRASHRWYCGVCGKLKPLAGSRRPGFRIMICSECSPAFDRALEQWMRNQVDRAVVRAITTARRELGIEK